MPNNKSLSNDGLSKKLYETFWKDIKDVFINLLEKAKIKVVSVYHKDKWL